ncbi:MAG: hypothetical protein AAFY34_02710 [Pseudomonadota bacterium]
MADQTHTTSPSPRHAPLSRNQIIRLAIVGIVTWYAVGVLLAWLGGVGAYNGSARLIMYAVIVLATPALLFALMPLAGIARNQLVLATSVLIATASLCDGLALAWLPQIYGGSLPMVAGAGGTILWGVGAACLISFFVNQEPKS